MDKKYEEECSVCEIDYKTKKELCSFCLAQKMIKGKWKMLIFWHLQKGSVRFNELNRLIPTTATTLSRQLKELENDGVIKRKVYEEIPPKVEYSLTPIGEEFKSVMDKMKDWGNSYVNSIKKDNS